MFLNKVARSGAPAAWDPSHERALIAETLLRSSASLMLGRSELEIIRGVCESIVSVTPRIRLAWTWFGPRDTATIRPQVSAGPAVAYAQELVIARNLLTQFGPAFSILDGKVPEPYAVSPTSLFGPWREAARSHGIQQVLGLPLNSSVDGFGGLFVLYADLPDYFDQVGTSLFGALADLFGSLMTLTAERAELQRAAYHDALTGLLNRHAIELVHRRVARASLFEPASSILMLDLDHFKGINDRYGHDVGDRVLQQVARVVQDTLRRQDEIVRWGGEEFLVCLPLTPMADALVVAEKLRAAMQRLSDPEPLTVSIGVAEVGALEHLTQAVTRADQALLSAKSGGRNQVCLAG